MGTKYTFTQSDKNLIAALINEIEKSAHNMRAQSGNTMTAEDAVTLLKNLVLKNRVIEIETGDITTDDQNLATETGRDATEQAS